MQNPSPSPTQQIINIQSNQIHYNQTLQPQLQTIKYSQPYSYLNDHAYQEQYLQLSNFTIQSQIHHQTIAFYQSKIEQSSTHQPKDNKRAIVSLEQLIVTLTTNLASNNSSVRIRLPKCKAIFIDIQTQYDGILQGQLDLQLSPSNQHRITLQNKEGKQKAIFSYTIVNKINAVSDSQPKNSNFQQSPQPLKNHNLHDKIQSNLLFSPHQPQHNHSEIFPSPHTQKDDIKIIVSSRIGKIKHSNDYKLQIDYQNHQQPEQSLHNRISSYKMPLVRYKQAVRRNQEELGISDRNIQHLFYHQYVHNHKNKTNNNEQVDIGGEQGLSSRQSQQIDMIVQSPEERASKLHNKGSKAQNRYKQMGMGTYTPLASRLASATNSNKSSNKSTKSNQFKREYVTQIIKEYQDLKKQKKKQQLSIRHYDIINSIPQQPAVQESTYRISQFKNHLTYKPKVLDLKVQAAPNQNIRSKTTSKNSSVYRKSSHQIPSLPSQKRRFSTQPKQPNNLQQYDQQFDLLINNINVNFHKKTFGTKYVQLQIFPNVYKTDELAGSNLIWIGKNYFFQKINIHQELIISVKQNDSDDMNSSTVGKIKIQIKDILNNKKQSYYQTLLLSKKSILANVLIGFQIIKIRYIPRQEMSAFSRRYHSGNRTKTTHLRTNTKHSTNQIVQNEPLSFDKMPQSKGNLIKMRKYLGGKNIKIGKSSRFYDQHEKDLPGPGQYQIESSFSRHAYKQM